MSNHPQVKCPTCKRRGDWFAGPFGPFCSKRCRLLDLGKWFNEEHVVADPLPPEQLEDFTDNADAKENEN